MDRIRLIPGNGIDLVITEPITQKESALVIIFKKKENVPKEISSQKFIGTAGFIQVVMKEF